MASKICSFCVAGDKIVITVRSKEKKVSCQKRERYSKLSSSLEDTTGDTGPDTAASTTWGRSAAASLSLFHSPLAIRY